MKWVKWNYPGNSNSPDASRRNNFQSLSRSFRTWNWKPESDRATVFPSVRPNCISLSAKRWRFWSNCCSAHFSRFLHGHGNENANDKNKGSELKAGKAGRKNRNRNRTRNRKRAAVQRSNFANCLGKRRKCFSSSRPHTPQAGWHKRWEMPAAVFGLIMKSPQPHPRRTKKKKGWAEIPRAGSWEMPATWLDASHCFLGVSSLIVC